MKLLDKEGLTYYTSKVKGQLAKKQNTIDNDHKLPYSLVSGTPTIPNKTSDLENDSGFITNAVSNLTNYYNKTYIDELVGDINTALDTINGEVI